MAVDGDGNALTTDSPGFPRVVNGTVDIGALASQGFTITATGGNDQSAAIGTNFAEPLTVTVTANDTDEPVDGGVVTFAAPSSSEASATLSVKSVVLSNGSAMVTATANGNVGIYTVTASTPGATTPASFSLTNNQGPLVVSDAGDYSQLNAGDNPIDTNSGISLRSAVAVADYDAAIGVSDTITFSPELNGSHSHPDSRTVRTDL